MKNNIIIFFVLLVFISCLNPAPRKPVSYHSGSSLIESITLNRKINKIQEKAINYYIAQDSLSVYFTSPDGFWYKYNKQVTNDSHKPVYGDEVLFEYEVSDLANNTLYSKEELGKRSLLIEKEAIEIGLQNGLKLMKEGEEITFIFPSYKAFGYTGDYQKIGTNQPLIYKVKLNKIINKNENN